MRYALLLLAALATACSPELAVPENVLVSCAEGKCPAGYNCNNAQLCVPSTSDDAIAPTLSEASYSPAVLARGVTTTLSFAASEPLLIDPVVTFTNNSIERRFVRSAKADGAQPLYQFQYTTTGDESDGESTVSADVIDLVGNTNTVTLPSIVIDMTPPHVVAQSELLDLTPSRNNNPLDEVTAITIGTQVRLTFVTSEPIANATPPAVNIGEAAVLQAAPLSASGTTSTVFAIDAPWAASVPDGTYVVTVTLTDAAGNVATTALNLVADGTPDGFVVDTTPPAPPGTVVLQRAPWGRLGDATAVTTVIGAAGTVESGATVAAYDSASVAYCGTSCRFSRSSIESGKADGTGAFTFNLGGLDRRTVYLAAVDAAGNTSDLSTDAGLQSKPVTIAQLEITLNAAFGRTNPNSAANAERLMPFLGDMLSRTADRAAVSTIDGTVSTAKQAFYWDAHPLAADATFAAFSASAAWFPPRGQVVISSTLATDSGAAIWIRDADGLHQSQQVIRRSTLAYDPVSAGVIAVATEDSYAMNIWDGSSWTELCSGSACSGPVDRSDFQLVTDAKRQVVVLIGEDGVVDEWDGVRWTRKCTTCTDLAIGLDAAAAFDPHLGEVVVLTATTPSQTWSWNGTAWTQRCASCSSVPSARTEAAIGLDESTGEIVLFGGINLDVASCSSGGFVLSDTWVWNGTTWRLAAQPSGSEVPSDGFTARTMAYDGRRQRLIMVGGEPVVCGGHDPNAPTGDPDSLREWTGSRWIRHPYDPSGLSVFGFDPVGHRGLGITQGATAQWNGTDWELFDTAGLPVGGGAMTRTYGSSDRLVYTTASASYVLGASGWSSTCSGSTCGLPGDHQGRQLTSDGTNAVLIDNDGSSDFVYRFNGTRWDTLCSNCEGHFANTIGYDGVSIHSMGGFSGSSFATLQTSPYAWVDAGGLPITGQTVVAAGAVYDSGRKGMAWVGGQMQVQGNFFERQGAQYYFPATGWEAAPPVSTLSPPTPNTSSSTAFYDETNAELVIVGGPTTYTLGSVAAPPALVLTLPLVDSMSLATSVLDQLVVDWYGTVTSGESSVRFSAWDGHRWADLVATPVGSGHWQVTITGPAFYVTGDKQSIVLAVTPAGVATVGGAASLMTDAVTARLDYHPNG